MTDVATSESPPPVCSHYRRGCKVLAECCKQWVGCRLCHNEQFLDHEIDRHAIRQMQCLTCNTIQPCAAKCSECSAVMGEYFCKVCNLFDNEGATKEIFHCDECGICRVGGRANYYHCKKCCGCYPHSLSEKHRCLEGSMHRECAICLEVTFSSLEGVIVMRCGHVLHHSCWRMYVRYGNAVCPTCRTSLISPSDAEEEANEQEANDVDDDDGSEFTDGSAEDVEEHDSAEDVEEYDSAEDFEDASDGAASEGVEDAAATERSSGVRPDSPNSPNQSE